MREKQFTDRDKEVLLFVQKYMMEHGYSPTIREIGKAVFMNPNSVQRHLYKMVELGYLSITPRTPRSIVLKMIV